MRKELLKPDLTAAGYEVVDVGTHNKDAVDCPDFTYAVAGWLALASLAQDHQWMGRALGAALW